MQQNKNHVREVSRIEFETRVNLIYAANDSFLPVDFLTWDRESSNHEKSK